MSINLKTIILALGCCAGIISCTQAYKNLDNQQFADFIVKNSVQLVDVRTPEEFAEKHIPGALNMNFNDAAFLDSVLVNLDKNKEVAVYCRSGRRSAEAASLLAKEGYRLVNLKDGILSWISDGRRVSDIHDYIVFDGDMAPDFTTQIYQGGEITLSELRGKVVMLQFTASWCSICRREMPHIEKDIWQAHKDNENFVLLAIDLKEGDEGIAKMISSTGITYPVLYDPEAKIFDLYNLHGAGVTRNVLIGKDGRIVMRTRRFHEEEFASLVTKINDLLK